MEETNVKPDTAIKFTIPARDGTYDVEIDPDKGRNIVLEWIRVSDANGYMDEPLGNIHVSINNGGIFKEVENGQFFAKDSTDNDWRKPNARSRAVAMRFTLLGVDGMECTGVIGQYFD